MFRRGCPSRPFPGTGTTAPGPLPPVHTSVPGQRHRDEFGLSAYCTAANRLRGRLVGWCRAVRDPAKRCFPVTADIDNNKYRVVEKAGFFFDHVWLSFRPAVYRRPPYYNNKTELKAVHDIHRKRSEPRGPERFTNSEALLFAEHNRYQCNTKPMSKTTWIQQFH